MPNRAAVAREMRQLCTQHSFLLGKQAMLRQGHDPVALHDHSGASRLRHMPSQPACHPLRCQGPGFRAVLVETYSSFSQCANLIMMALTTTIKPVPA